MEQKKIKGLQIKFYKDTMKIIDSFKIKSSEKMKVILEEALKRSNEFSTERSIKDLIKEWKTHNRLHKINFFTKRTKDCDFNKTINPFYQFIYNIIGCENVFKKRKKYLKQKRQQEKRYEKYIEEHRENISKAFNELNKTTIILQYGGWDLLEIMEERINTHDLSKYSKEEFDAYRKNFFPINEKEKENNKVAFEKAWEHHWKNNSHHWQNRKDKKTFNKKDLEQVADVLENVCDWLAMGYKFGDRPYQYYEKNKDKIQLNEEEKKFLEDIIYNYIDYEYIHKKEV